MPTYFDPITQETLEIDSAQGTILYLIQVEDKYKIHALSSGIDQVPSDPTTHATHYWRINDIDAFIAKVNAAHLSSEIFPHGQLTTRALTLSMLHTLELHPEREAPTPFSAQVRAELVSEWQRDILEHWLTRRSATTPQLTRSTLLNLLSSPELQQIIHLLTPAQIVAALMLFATRDAHVSQSLVEHLIQPRDSVAVNFLAQQSTSTHQNFFIMNRYHSNALIMNHYRSSDDIFREIGIIPSNRLGL